MGGGLFKAKLSMHLADPSLIPRVMSGVEEMLRNNNCSYTRFPSWLIGVCGDSLVKVRVPLGGASGLEIPISKSIIEVTLESKEPHSLLRLASVLHKLIDGLKGLGVGITLES